MLAQVRALRERLKVPPLIEASLRRAQDEGRPHVLVAQRRRSCIG